MRVLTRATMTMLLALVACNSLYALNEDLLLAWQKYLKARSSDNQRAKLSAAENAAAVGRFEMGMDHPTTLLAYEWVISGFEKAGNQDKAQAYIDDLANANIKRLKPVSSRMISALHILGTTQLSIGLKRQSLKTFQKLLKMRKRLSRSNIQELARDYLRIARVLTKAKMFKSAFRCAKKALRLQKRCRDLNEIALAYECLGKIFARTGHNEKAKRMFTKASKAKKLSNAA